MPTLPAPVSLPADPSRGRLAGKTCALFGAGQSPGEPGFLGNGRATVMRMAQEGCRVLAVDSDPASAEETARLANAQPGLPLKDPVVAYKADVAEESEVKAALDEVVRRWGTLSIVHYNVGVSVGAGDGPLAAMTRDRFEKVSRVNLWGLVAAAKHAAEIMGKQEGGGVICSISSAAAVENSYPNVVYRLTKSAIVSFTSSQALQLAPRLIRVNTVLPGLIDTPMAVDTRARVLNRPRADVQAERDRRVPLGGKQGSPWDVANAVVWLCSDEARWVTGQALGVCGGGTLGRL
ncbi:putative oxidoreductase [Hyaloraphidium curvatum]|nr:putative oxidoreductase [Hyaloraphidium curvatum]